MSHFITSTHPTSACGRPPSLRAERGKAFPMYIGKAWGESKIMTFNIA